MTKLKYLDTFFEYTSDNISLYIEHTEWDKIKEARIDLDSMFVVKKR